VLDLYFRPGVRKDGNDPSVQAMALMLGRTPDSVAMRLHNYEAVDPRVPKKALDRGGRMAGEVFEAYSGRPASLPEEAEEIRARLMEGGAPTDSETEDQLRKIRAGSYRVEDGEALTKVRRGQAAFARIVKANYGSSCAICGLDFPGLLIASHIKPWADDPEHRLDPANGLCLCALHDRLFDQGLISISPQLRVLVSRDLQVAATPVIRSIVAALDGVELRAPTSGPPDERMLQYHRDAVFRGQ
jgi:putative restriction endonuclease